MTTISVEYKLDESYKGGRPDADGEYRLVSTNPTGDGPSYDVIYLNAERLREFGVEPPEETITVELPRSVAQAYADTAWSNVECDAVVDAARKALGGGAS